MLRILKIVLFIFAPLLVLSQGLEGNGNGSGLGGSGLSGGVTNVTGDCELVCYSLPTESNIIHQGWKCFLNKSAIIRDSLNVTQPTAIEVDCATIEFTTELICYELTGGDPQSAITLKEVRAWDGDQLLWIRYYYPNADFFQAAPLANKIAYGRCNDAVEIFTECWAKRDALINLRYETRTSVTPPPYVLTLPDNVTNIFTGVYFFPSGLASFETDFDNFFVSNNYLGTYEITYDAKTTILTIDIEDTDETLEGAYFQGKLGSFENSGEGKWEGKYKDCVTIYKGLFKDLLLDEVYVKDTILICDAEGNILKNPIAAQTEWVFDTTGMVRVSCEACLDDALPYEKEFGVCVKSKTLYTVIDNTGTSYANENELRLYFTDGTFVDITQPAQSNPQGWTKQLQVWDDLITNVLESKCAASSVETRFNPPPYTSNDLSNYTPPDGLLVPPSELWGLIPKMAYRYLQISACSTCPAINKAELISVNGTPLTTPPPMTLSFVEGLEKRYDLCKECGEAGTLYYQGTNRVVEEADYPVCFFDCGETLPPVPESGCLFTLRESCDDGVLDANGDPKPITVRYSDCGDGEIISNIYEADADGGLIDYVLVGSVVDCESGAVVEPPEPTVEETNFSTICKPACVNGVQRDVIIGYAADGTVIWYKDENGTTITKPDFTGSCDPITCTEETEKACADGNYTNPTINDGDEILLIVTVCSDGSRQVTGAVLYTDFSTSITLPSNFLSKPCPTGGVEPVLIGCVVDEKGTKWNSILIDGVFAYQNIGTGLFGTPAGTTKDCEIDRKPIAVADSKWCAIVGNDTLDVEKILFDDGSYGVKEVGGITIYEEGDYTLISCCPTERTESLYYSGFTAQRPLPNTSWNNQLITGSAGLSGDFEMCFTPESETLNSPQMIGFNSDPNTNASYQSIDCAMYIWNNGGSYRLYQYQNGTYSGLMSTQNWVGKEICMQRVGGTITYKLAGSTIGTCNIGTGTVFLDDSHYSVNSGTWVNGSITYSDFLLVEYEEDNRIKCQADCKASEPNCEVITYYETEGVTGTLRNRQWELGADLPLSTPLADFRTMRENFDFTAVTTVDSDISSFAVDDTNNSATISDAQVIEGFIIVSEPTLIRWSGASYGYQSLELGQCCGERELIMENRLGGGTNTLTDEYILPVGTHSYRIFNIDDYSNTSRNLQYSLDAGTTWITDNTPPNVKFSKTKPTEETRKGWLCEGGFYFDDTGNNPINVMSDSISCSPTACEASSGGGSGGEVTGTVMIDCPDDYQSRQFDNAQTITDVYSLTVRVETGTTTVTLPSGDVQIYERGDVQTWIYPKECGSFLGNFTISTTGTFEAIWVEKI